MKKFLGISFIAVLIDRIIKVLVVNFLSYNHLYFITNFFYLVYAKNDGAAFSILGGKQLLLILLGLIGIFIIVYYVKKNKVSNIGYSLLLGGIIGNLIDRICFKYVIDYIGVKIFSYYFPIFNIADAFIVVGAFLILIVGDKNESSI